jgi:hypothetical protein
MAAGRGPRRPAAAEGGQGTGTGNADTGRGLRRKPAHLPLPPGGTGGGEASPPGRLGGGPTTCRERSDPPPVFPQETRRAPPNPFGGGGESGRARCPTNPGQEAQAERSDPAAGMTRPARLAVAPSPASAGRGVPAAGAGPRRVTQGQPRWLAGRWPDRKRRSDHELVSSGVEQDAIPRPSRQYWHWFQCSSPGSRQRSSPSWT